MKRLIILLLILINGCTGSLTPKLPDISRAKHYSLITSQLDIDQIDEHFVLGEKGRREIARRGQANDRKRDSIYIVATNNDAQTIDERAHTAMKAAADIQKQVGLDAVEVFLEPSLSLIGKGHVIAIARYAPDGKGFSGSGQNQVWEVESSDTPLTQEQLTIADLWYQHRGDFQQADGITDEPKLKAFLAKTYKLKKEQIILPLFIKTKYAPSFPK